MLRAASRNNLPCTIPSDVTHIPANMMLEADKTKWISVKDRLPDCINAESNSHQVTDMVLATTAGYILFGYFDIYKYNGTWEFVSVDTDMDFDRCVTVTHWMPLPEPPKEE